MISALSQIVIELFPPPTFQIERFKVSQRGVGFVFLIISDVVHVPFNRGPLLVHVFDHFDLMRIQLLLTLMIPVMMMMFVGSLQTAAGIVIEKDGLVIVVVFAFISAAGIPFFFLTLSVGGDGRSSSSRGGHFL